MPYWFTAPNLAVAAAVVLELGRGKYGVRALDGSGDEMPMIVAKNQIDAWAKRALDMPMQEAIKKVTKDWIIDLIAAMDAVTMGLPGNEARITPRVDLAYHAKLAAAQARVKLARNLSQKKRVH